MKSSNELERSISVDVKPLGEIPTNLRLVSLMVFTLLLFGSCSSNRSMIYIPAEREFVLGADENQNFRVDLQNTSRLPVAVIAVDKKTEIQTQGFSLPARGSARVFIGRKEKVLLKNPHPEEVRIKASLSKGVAGMSYRPLEKEP